MTQSGIEDIKKLLSVYKGNFIDVCFKIYSIIADSDNPPEVLQFFLESYEDIESSGTAEIAVVFSDQEKRSLYRDYNVLVKGILDKLIGEKPEVFVFYQKLWDYIHSDFLFETQKQKAFALCAVCNDSRIPYFKLEQGLKMSQEDFSNNATALMRELKKVRSIMSSEYEQHTERASLLLNVMDELQSEEQKAVLMVFIMAICEKQNAEDED